MKSAYLRLSTPKARAKAPVMRKCAACKMPFAKQKMGQKVCDWQCGLVLAAREREKAERVSDRERKQKLKTISEWEKDAEEEVNRYVRLRDVNLGCVSCDKPANWPGQWHASHFRSVGAASATRFNLWNIHKACGQCNKWKSGNLSEYEPRLIAKIGKEKVDWLRTQNQITRRSVEYLQRLRAVFRKKANRQERRLASLG